MSVVDPPDLMLPFRVMLLAVKVVAADVWMLPVMLTEVPAVRVAESPVMDPDDIVMELPVKVPAPPLRMVPANPNVPVAFMVSAPSVERLPAVILIAPVEVTFAPPVAWTVPPRLTVLPDKVPVPVMEAPPLNVRVFVALIVVEPGEFRLPPIVIELPDRL